MTDEQSEFGIESSGQVKAEIQKPESFLSRYAVSGWSGAEIGLLSPSNTVFPVSFISRAESLGNSLVISVSHYDTGFC